MQVFNITNSPVYLPYDRSDPPFGDNLVVSSITIAAPGVVTVPGTYFPANGDAVSFTTTGALPTGITAGTTYYVVGAAGLTFNISATKGGGAITTTGSQSGTHTLHLLSFQTDGALCPFKTGDTVVVLNLSGGSLTLQSAPDSGTVFGQPAGPGAYSTVITLAAGSAGLAQLNNDWIRVSTAATLVLLQN